MDNKSELIRESFDYILRLEDAIKRDIKVPYGNNPNKFFTKKDFLMHINFAYAKLHACLREN